MTLFDPRGVAATRRRFLGQVGFAGLAMAATPVWAEKVVKLPLPGGPEERPLTTDFPQKGPMILQRTRPPLLETPFEVFDRGVFTPNDQFYVRWHWAAIPNAVDVETFRLTVRGHVDKTLSLSLNDIVNGLLETLTSHGSSEYTVSRQVPPKCYHFVDRLVPRSACPFAPSPLQGLRCYYEQVRP